MNKYDVEFIDDLDFGFSMQETLYENMVCADKTNVNNRTSLFSWYPLEGNILEIGCCYGEIIRILSEKCKTLYAIEIKKERYDLIKEQIKDLNNVELINDNISKYKTNIQFNYIIVHDIFPILKKYYGCKDYINVFFQQMYNLLLPNGRLLIETTNRLGIKYQAGVLDEFTGKQYSSVNRFINYDYVKTFSKDEWNILFGRTEFSKIKFYYPYPNSFDISEVQTDLSLQYLSFSNTVLNKYTDYAFFNYNMVLEDFHGSTSAHLANTFLIEFSKEDSTKIIYVDCTNDNRPMVYSNKSGIEHNSNYVDSYFLKFRLDNYLMKKIKEYDIFGKKDMFEKEVLYPIMIKLKKRIKNSDSEEIISYRNIFYRNEKILFIKCDNSQYINEQQFLQIKRTIKKLLSSYYSDNVKSEEIKIIEMNYEKSDMILKYYSPIENVENPEYYICNEEKEIARKVFNFFYENKL